MANWYDGIPAPVDRNGDVMPLDTRELVFMGERREVFCYEYIPDNKRWFVRFVGSHVPSEVYKCSLPDSWEQLEKDARKTPREYVEGRCVIVERDGRVAAMTHDLVRRAKALAGVDGE